MRGKLAGYSFLAFLSFVIFILLFHTISFASAHSLPFLTPPTPTPTPSATPTPTPTLTPTPTNTPTPTITPTPTVTPTPSPIPTITLSNNDLERFFTDASNMYGVEKGELEKIARCESGFNTNSNYKDLYVGMFQFAESAWVSTRHAMSMDPNPDLRRDAEQSIKTAAFLIQHGGINSWPSCR